MEYLGAQKQKVIIGSEPWWTLRDPEKRAKAVCVLVDFLRDMPDEKERQRCAVHHARLYGNRYFKNLTPYGHARMPRAQRKQRLTANVCKAVVDAATAKIAQNRPLATLLTNDGTWEQMHRAKQLTRFVEGAFQDLELYVRGPRMFRSAGIFGDGLLKFYAEHGRVCVDRVLPSQVIVDPVEGIYGKPRCMYQIHWIDRHVLLEMYGGARKSSALADKIRRATASQDPDLIGDLRSLAEPVRVVEAWHLPSGPDAKDGQHVIAIEDAQLQSRPWTRDTFPFVRYTWAERELGFWGAGLVEEVELKQLAINRTLKRIEDCLRLMAVPRILVDSTAKLVTSMVTNEVGSILKYTGGQGGHPPQFLTPPAVPPELFHHLEWLIRQAFEDTGLSQLGASSKKPAGLDSGRALLVYNDIESERFAIHGRNYEHAYMKMADQILELAEEIDNDPKAGNFSVVNRTRTSAERLDWKDVRMDRESYVLQVHPTSALPHDVAGRTAIVQQWEAAGHVDKRTAHRLLDFPDLDSHTNVAFSAMEVVDRTIARFIDPDREADDPDTYLPPEPFDDLEYALQHVTLAYHRARLDGVPEDRLDLFRQWIDEAQALLDAAAGAEMDAAQPPAAAPATPPAAAAEPSLSALPSPAIEAA